MKIVQIVTCTFFVLAAGFHVRAQDPAVPAVYVWDFADRAMNKSALTDKFTHDFEEALGACGKYRVVERRQLEELIPQAEHEKKITSANDFSPATVNSLKLQKAEMIVLGEVYDDVDSGQVDITVTFEDFTGQKRLEKDVLMSRGLVNDAPSRRAIMKNLVDDLCGTASPAAAAAPGLTATPPATRDDLIAAIKKGPSFYGTANQEGLGDSTVDARIYWDPRAQRASGVIDFLTFDLKRNVTGMIVEDKDDPTQLDLWLKSVNNDVNFFLKIPSAGQPLAGTWKAVGRAKGDGTLTLTPSAQASSPSAPPVQSPPSVAPGTAIPVATLEEIDPVNGLSQSYQAQTTTGFYLDNGTVVPAGTPVLISLEKNGNAVGLRLGSVIFNGTSIALKTDWLALQVKPAAAASPSLFNPTGSGWSLNPNALFKGHAASNGKIPAQTRYTFNVAANE
jgi:hypothetical protein